MAASSQLLSDCPSCVSANPASNAATLGASIMVGIFLQQHAPRGERHLDAFLTEAAQDPTAQLVSDPELVGKLGHVVVEAESQRRLAEAGIEGNRRRRL